MGDTNANAKVMDLLSSVPYFQGLDQRMLERISRTLVKRSYGAGEVVFFEGEVGTRLYIIGEGYLKAVKVSTEGREQVLQILGEGEMFGVVAVLHARENPATVMALEASTVYSIDQATMQELIASSNALAGSIINNLAGRVLHLVDLVEDLSLRSVESRLARMLIERSDSGVVMRHRWTTQAEMAARLGTVPDVISRALRGLVEEGAIELERHEIRLLNTDLLRSKAMIGP